MMSRDNNIFKSAELQRGTNKNKEKGEYGAVGRGERIKTCPTPPVPSLPICLLLLVSPTPFFGIYLEYERIEATPGLTDTVLLY